MARCRIRAVSKPLIINARRHLSWNRRLLSDASTLVLWTMWLWLCRSALLRFIGMMGVMLGLRHAAHGATTGQLMFAGAVLTIEDAAVALVGTCGMLMLWNRLSSQPAPMPRLNMTPDYAGYFDLEPQVLAKARASSVCTVHHDETGRILRIDAGPAAPDA
jgi:poly-beta-1,6-N-acetyl-D-glucosamine biosynthesis protein PgaD